MAAAFFFERRIHHLFDSLHYSSIPHTTCKMEAYEDFGSTSDEMRDIVIVKVGGSAITDKTKFETIKEAELDSFAYQVESLTAGNDNVKHKFVIVHGAGSFGHFSAREYSLSSGGLAGSWRKGFAKTHSSVTRLNWLVVDALLKRNVSEAVGLPLFPTVKTNTKGIIEKAGVLDSIHELLDMNFIPVLCGDCVLDVSQTCSIFGGDSIMNWLCDLSIMKTGTARNRVKAAVFLTDVPGVLDRPPDRPGAKLIKRIEVSPNGSIVLNAELECLEHDVTGGIKAKIASAVDIALSSRAPVYIVQNGTEHALAALAGVQPNLCTTVILSTT